MRATSVPDGSSRSRLGRGRDSESRSKRRNVRGHVLIVEDNTINARVLQRQLTQNEFTTTLAPHGLAALEVLKATEDQRSEAADPHGIDLVYVAKLGGLRWTELTKVQLRLMDIGERLETYQRKVD